MEFVILLFFQPEFTYVSTCGPSHAPSFTFKCKLNSIERTAEAGSKQLAKQLSAKSVFDVIKMVRNILSIFLKSSVIFFFLQSFPDIEKKLSVVHDTPQQHEAKVRHKITTYLDLKKKTKDGEFKGTSIKDRHMFFRAQDAELVDCLLEILRSTDEEEEKFQKLVMELETMWTVSFGKFLETDMMKFEVEIDYEKFTCVVIGAEKNIKGNVLQYFCEMMDIDFEETVEGGSMSPLEDVSVHSYGSCEENVLEK